MDWSRECYQSFWHLFRDAPDVPTAGYYYHADTDADHYPGFHLLGSRRWLDDNNGLEQSLGEDLTTRQLHLDGTFIGARPLSRYVGTKSAIQNGDSLDKHADPAELLNGYPAACYVPVAQLQPPQEDELQDFHRASSSRRCEVQRFWAEVIERLYINDSAGARALLNTFFDTPVSITLLSATPQYPAMAIVISPNFVCVALDGTRNFTQLALQAFALVRPPQDFGPYGSSPIWQAAANYVIATLTALGVADTRPIFVAGHSYGAAAAVNLCGIFRAASAAREIRYVTYGLNKIGDNRLRTLLANCHGVSLQNDTDLVCALPPDQRTYQALLPLFPLLVMANWNGWERAPDVLTQDVDGALTTEPVPELSFEQLFAFIFAAATPGPFPTVADHAMSEYLRRITLRCPNKLWPLNDAVFVIMESDEPSEGGVVFSGGPGSNEGSGTILFDGGNQAIPDNPGGILIDGPNEPPPEPGGILFDGGD